MARSAVSGRFLQRDMGTCLRFNGSAGKVVGTSLSGMSSGFSISAWFKISPGIASSAAIFTNATGSNDRIGFSVNSGKLRGGYFNGSFVGIKESDLAVPLGVWMHGVYTFNGTTGALYLNGVSQSATGTGPSTSATNNMTVGARTDSSQFFLGLIDEVLIWNRSLTSGEVLDLFYLGSLPSTGANRLWYKFDEGSGSSATDSSGNSNTGTITSATYSTDVALKTRAVTSGRVSSSDRVLI